MPRPTTTKPAGGRNSVPVAADDSGFFAHSDELLTINVSELLANDSDTDKRDVLTVSGVANGNGTTVNLSGQTITVDFNDGFSGEGNFSYTVSDGRGGTDIASVSVIATVASAPVTPAPGVITLVLNLGNPDTNEVDDAQFLVSVYGDNPTPVSVDYVTRDGTATAAEDYTATSGTLIIPAHSDHVLYSIFVPVTDDTKDESRIINGVSESNDGTFFLVFSNPVGAEFAAGGSIVSSTITDNDRPLI